MAWMLTVVSNIDLNLAGRKRTTRSNSKVISIKVMVKYLSVYKIRKAKVAPWKLPPKKLMDERRFGHNAVGDAATGKSK